MYEYYVSDQLARLTIVLGIVISTIIYKKTGRTLGGVIVCGYLALFIGQPAHIVVTLAMAYFTYQIVHNILKKRYMLNGRKLFEVEILVGLLFQISWLVLIKILARDVDVDLTALYGIGFVLPGVIAHDMGRQGPTNTLSSIFLGVLVVSLIIIPLSAIEQVLPLKFSYANTTLYRAQPYQYTYPLKLLPFGIIASVVIDFIIYSRLHYRAGGFVTAAYLALFAFRPLDLLFVVGCSFITFWFVKFVTSRVVLAFGRTKLGIMILSGVVIAWGLESLITVLTNGRYIPWSGFVVIMPTIVSLIANDYDRQGPYRTMSAISFSAIGVFLVMQVFVFVLNFLGLQWLYIT
ncbi:MAG: poly-gamma-glutamate biosynthesis protein PgsC/CapC [Chloroflexota bacterium]